MHSNTFSVDVLGETEALLNNRLDGLYGCCALNRITLIRVGKRDSNYAVGSYPFLPTFPQGWAFFWRIRMKANEFVKKYGWNEAIFYAKQVDDKWVGFDIDGVDIILNGFELKRLVESHELIIKDFESIEMAKYEYMVSGSHSDPYWIQVKQAIADVESCQ